MKVSDNIQSAMKSDEPAPPVSAVTGFEVTKVVRDGKEIDTDKYYIGDKVRLSVSVLPENADTSDLYFERGANEPEDCINVEKRRSHASRMGLAQSACEITQKPVRYPF